MFARNPGMISHKRYPIAAWSDRAPEPDARATLNMIWKNNPFVRVAVLCGSLLALPFATAAVEFEPDGGPVSFGAAEIAAALRSPRGAGAPRIVLTRTGSGAPESFRVRVLGTGAAREIRIEGADAAGAMYGALELAETLRLGGPEAVRDLERTPRLAERGVKFNLPLDARSPSYSDASDSAQRNIATVWDLTFWHEFIDRLARDRYNLVSLWNLHPFPSLVRVPEYPDIALADVQRSTTTAWQEHYPLQATGLDAPEILGRVETLRRLTIEEKIAFWREVMRYGRSRNVKFYVVTWNIYTNGIAGKHGIVPDWKNATTADYFRRSVRELVLTYPDLAGIGLTTGEFMPGATAPEKEEWAFRTYGQGVLDALAVQPERKITFIHRQHEAGAAEIRQRFGPLLAHPRVDFVYSFKYAEAHALATTAPRFHQKFVADIGNQPVLWTLRNDDNYVFRWGAPDFVRAFVRGIPAANTRGFYYGSDQWIWGREFLDLARGAAGDAGPASAPASRPLEIAKHDYHWRLWGRLGYDPDLSDDRLVALLAEKFPSTDARALFAAWQDASMIYPLTTGFHWGALDFQWYIEGCQSRAEFAQTPTGFHDINRFISLRPHPASDNISIPDFVVATRTGKPRPGTTPPEVTARLQTHATQALAAADRLSATAPLGSELWHTLEDIRAMAHLGRYYAHKIRAATALAQFRATLERAQHTIVTTELNHAAAAWRIYTASAVTRYANPMWTNRVGTVDWRRTYTSALYDLTIAGAAAEVPSLAATPGGTILEAEDATGERLAFADATPGFTGRGYLDFDHTQDPRTVTWTFTAPAAGPYLLEIRYAMRRGETSAATMTINGTATELLLWPTGGAKTWMWDRKLVVLQRGENRIKLRPSAVISLDHLNVLR